jgi:hypothetical protein
LSGTWPVIAMVSWGCRAQLIREPTRFGHHERHLVLALLGRVEGDVDRGRAGIGRDQAIDQQRLAQRRGPDPLERLRREPDAFRHQVFDDQLVTQGVGVLEVGDRIDAGRERQLPGGVGESPERLEHRRLEHHAVIGPDHEQQVVGLGIGVLQRLERGELGVVAAEEDPVVGRELEEAHAGRAAGCEQKRQRQDQPAPAQDPVRETRQPPGAGPAAERGRVLSKLSVRRHGLPAPVPGPLSRS